ncbi:MAG: bifunctional 4-hydroxy-3-methylbut-2-enyl diphosphate reductase/30S ribosomal protein S1 [Clostridia bacterium]|nr:bifunctional 4-hydroxy-3-methylbut-2-enyl diphosphate reductase/30S ribosomal protein S1 [Clostridia bacterium]
MKITVAENAGFCFGVNKAIETVQDLLKQNLKICTLGPIIHNPQMINHFKNKGVVIVNSPAETPGDYTLVIRSHGVPRKTMQEIENLKLSCVDVTCPFVKKIHSLVSNENYKGYSVFIFGDKNHAEVIGISGYCLDKKYIFNNFAELAETIKADTIPKNEKILVVQQTTFNVDEWSKCLKILKKHYTNCVIFDTICNTTQIRQQEAISLAKKSDLMVVIGGKKSSNTMKLFDVCNKFSDTILIESSDDLPKYFSKKLSNIGITAGASTPDYLILEVKRKMEKIMEGNDISTVEENFAEMLEESLENMSNSKRVKGTVVNITPSEVYVDIGRKYAGIVPAAELSTDPNVRCEDIVKIGDVLDLLILKTDDQNGTVTLSKKKIDCTKSFEEVTKAMEENAVLSGKVQEIVNGGLIIPYNGINIFIPPSLVYLRKPADQENLKNQNVKFRIIKVNKFRNRVIGSIKSVLIDEKKENEERFWRNTEVGDKLTGTVVSLTPYGAFVDVGGVCGLIHISELSWIRVKRPSDVLSIGDQVDVVVIGLDREKSIMALSYKRSQENPWEIFKRDYSIGSIVDATIVNLTEFGAFARILPGVDGLIHISKISRERIKNPKDVLAIGDIVKAKIIYIDLDNHKVGLSMINLQEEDNEDSGGNAEPTEELQNNDQQDEK